VRDEPGNKPFAAYLPARIVLNIFRMTLIVGTLLVLLAAGGSLALGHFLHRRFPPRPFPVRQAVPGAFRSLSQRAFCRLSQEHRLSTVQHEGTFLALRLQENDLVALFYLPGNFFCELYVDVECPGMVRLCTFTCTAYLEDYLEYISLIELAL